MTATQHKLEDSPVLKVGFGYDHEDDLTKPYLTAQEPDVEPTPLTKTEQELLKQCEAEIEENLQGFTIVGARLFTIWSKKLYRDTHSSFEAYCKEKWGISRFHASRLIKGSQVVENLKQHQLGNTSIPPTEAAAREIADLNPDEQVEVAKRVKKAVSKRKANAKDFKKARNEVVGPKRSKQPKVATQDKPANVIPIPAPKGKVLVELPFNYHKTLRELPSLQQLTEMAVEAENMRSKSGKQADFDKLMGQLRKWLSLYAEWEAKCLIPAQRQAALNFLAA